MKLSNLKHYNKGLNKNIKRLWCVHIITILLLLFISPDSSFYWLFFPTVYYSFFENGSLKKVFLIWIVFFLSWYLAFTGYMIVTGYSDVIWIGGYYGEHSIDLFRHLGGYKRPPFSIWDRLSLKAFGIQTILMLDLLIVGELGVPFFSIPSPFRGVSKGLLALLRYIYGK